VRSIGTILFTCGDCWLLALYRFLVLEQEEVVEGGGRPVQVRRKLLTFVLHFDFCNHCNFEFSINEEVYLGC
jgi:hypothetical protein